MTDISDPHFAERVRESFDRQNVMHLIRATLPVIEQGRTEKSIFPTGRALSSSMALCMVASPGPLPIRPRATRR
jgi:hypothetical protein